MSRTSPTVVLVADPAEAALRVVDEIAELAERMRKQAGALVLGLSTGRSPIAVYDEIVRRVAAGSLDLSQAIAFNLDEYCGIEPGDPDSFAAWMRVRLFDRLAWPVSRAHIPAGHVAPGERERHCAEYEARIRACGGIDLQLLGLGRNGHIGFNEPGSARDSRTRHVALDPGTIAEAAGGFGARAVPSQALTMGIATILEARRVRLLAFGEKKRAALGRALDGPVGPECPASFLRHHTDAIFFVDAAALGSPR